MTASRPSRPRRLIVLDGLPSNRWVLDEEANYLWQGKLWAQEQIGCALCYELQGPEYVTLCHVDDEGHEQLHCMAHGELVTVPYFLSKVYTLRVGDISREGEETLDDVILLPAAMTAAQRNEVIEKMIDDAVEEEREAGPAP